MSDQMNPAIPAPARPAQYGPSLNLAQARCALDAAVEYAQARNWPMAIAVVDNAGQLMLFARLDQTQTGSIKVSQQKAETAVAFRRPTAVFQDALAAGGMHLRLLAMNNLLPLEGGLPLSIDGLVVGGIGVSGMQSDQDVQVAQAGVTALQRSSNQIA